ncbi:hypothetical protein OB08_07855 [Microbacterium sp. HJ5]
MALAHARTGCPAAVEWLFRTHFGALRRWASRVTTRFDPDDLAAEAFTAMLEALRRGHGPEVAAGAYLRVSVRNLSMTWARRTVTSLESFGGDRLPDPFDRFAVVDSAQDLTVVRAAIGALPERWQRVIILREVEGLSVTEVGSELNLSANAVSQLHWRALQGLRKALAKAV